MSPRSTKTIPSPAETTTPRSNSAPYQPPPPKKPGNHHEASLKSWWRRLTQHSSGNPDTPRALSNAHKRVYIPRHAKRDALLSMPANLYRSPSATAGEDPGLAVHPNREAYLRRLHSSNGSRKRGSPAWISREASSSGREGMESIREDDPDAGEWQSPAPSQVHPAAQHSFTASASGTPPTTAATSVDNGGKPSAYEVRARLQEVRAAKIERHLQAQINGWGGASGRGSEGVPTHPSPSNADGEDTRGKKKARAVIVDPEVLAPADRISPSEFPLPPPATPWSAHQRNESFETVEYSPTGTAFTSDIEGGVGSVSAGSVTSAEGEEMEEKREMGQEGDVDVDGWGRGVLEAARAGL